MIARIDLNYDKLVEVIFRKKRIGQGCFGTVYEYDEDHLIKFENQMLNSADFPSEADVKFYLDRNQMYPKQENYLFACDILKQQDLLASKQKQVKLSSFPKAIALFNGRPIALILKHHKAYKKLSELRLSYAETMSLFDQYEDIVEELLENAVYNFDTDNANNILYNETSAKVQAIDFDGPTLFVMEETNEIDANSVYARLYGLQRCLAKRFVSDPLEFDIKISENRLFKVISNDYYDCKDKVNEIVKKIGVKK